MKLRQACIHPWLAQTRVHAGAVAAAAAAAAAAADAEGGVEAAPAGLRMSTGSAQSDAAHHLLFKFCSVPALAQELYWTF